VDHEASNHRIAALFGQLLVRICPVQSEIVTGGNAAKSETFANGWLVEVNILLG